MCPVAASPITEMEFDCRNGTIFVSLSKLNTGSPPPDNVISDVNPFHYAPGNVPGKNYFLSVDPFQEQVFLHKDFEIQCLFDYFDHLLCPAMQELLTVVARTILLTQLDCTMKTHKDPYAENIWFYIKTERNGSTYLGRWKVKGEACKLFSNSILTGWRTTFEFFEGPVSDEHKTNWLLEKYWITQKEPVENSKEKGASSLCRIYCGGKESTKLGNQTGTSVCTVTEGCTHLQHLVPQMNDNVTDNGSTSKREVHQP